VVGDDEGATVGCSTQVCVSSEQRSGPSEHIVGVSAQLSPVFKNRKSEGSSVTPGMALKSGKGP
jgi:hypothetical protein